MANVLSAYNPIFYANEGLEALHKALGMAGHVWRGLDDSNSSRQYGDTITMRVPGAFSALDAPSAAQDIGASSVSLVLNIWKEVKITLTDKELAFTQQRIVQEHVVPAMYALADKMDQLLFAEYVNVPWTSAWSNTAVVADITTGFRKKMFDNKVNFSDPSKLHVALDSTTEGDLLALQAFAQYQGGGPTGVDVQMNGYLGKRYGFNFFASQNVPSVTSGTVADLVGTATNNTAIGLKTLVIGAVTVSVTLPIGTIMQVSGHTQQYSLTAAMVVDGAGAGTATFQGTPFVQGGGLEAAVTATTVVTFVLAAGSGGTKNIGMAWHESAFALAVAKLPDFMNGQGVMVHTASDPDTQLSLRARTWADPNNSQFYIAYDILAGIKTIDGNKACRLTR
jgi:hypothetical protein